MIVFQIISSFDLGGAERVAINITKSPNPNFKYHLFEVVKDTPISLPLLKRV